MPQSVTSQAIKNLFVVLSFCCLTVSHSAFSEDANEAIEPTVAGPGTIDLLENDSPDAWVIPSARWTLEGQRIVGHTGTEKLDVSEWIYTRERFDDFVFTSELKLTGDNNRNTGIYYRVNTIPYGKGEKAFDAPSGYEFDAAYYDATKKTNYRGSLGDWYSRPSVRVLADPSVLNLAYKPDDWNRMTIRARGNRLEYWINGIKVLDFQDPDPNGSREGTIGFQLHDGTVMQAEYRHIRIRKLEK